ncbi:multiple sugar transport system substrate-binding protein/raffinose/stachyose/melibiose transport system substrate-binding protein [Streptomyces sp. DvalAA-14]|uniref:ABC transporter substrate-binding protein n=1 Tax=unclassified Streptomyces TaxID=2593676 RepID=UPI00081B6B36|nr:MULTISPECIES: extracellular solute-binding protein [unclassified Streptomyces]MYS20997.1 extracellular solute-binding protein [Streptomyces sp. SID4948]SCD81646.1 multiple sugar transport system substrate-binding protein/raffinose/stachyose/melibiose transport system substrate-binding protein [Streptomyces sp. DvalAA-14]
MLRRSAAVIAAAGLALLAACSNSASDGSSASGGKTLTYLTFNSPSLTPAFWKASIARAEKSVPGTSIKQVVAPSTDRDSYAKQLQASGQFPDLLQSITPSQYTAAGLLQPYDQSWIDQNFLLPQGNAIKGKVYIPPTNSQIIPLVFYNKKLFAQAGVQPPTTWQQFLDVSAKLKTAGVTPIELGGNDPFAAAMPLTGAISADVIGKNPQWIQQRYAGTVKFSDPDVVTAAQKMRTLVEKDYFEQGALNVSYADSIKNFNAGKAAMYPMGSWYLGSIPKDQWSNIGVFPWPTDDGSVVVPFAVGGSMAISTKAKDVTAATTFAKAWSLDPGNLKALIEGDGAYPMLKGKTLQDYGVTVSPAFSDSYAYVTKTNTKVSAIGWATNDDALPGSLNNDFYAAAQALFNSKDVKGEMSKLDQSWNTATK